MFLAILPLLAACAGTTATAPAPPADTTAAAALELDALAAGLLHEKPDLDPDTARAHAAAALSAAYRELTAEVLLGIALRESDLELDAAPQCGVLQATIHELGGRRACAAARATVLDSYRLGVRHLGEDLETCRTWRASGKLAHGVSVLRCCLNMYAEGPAAGRRGWGVKGCPKHTHCDRSAVPLAHARRIEHASASS